MELTPDLAGKLLQASLTGAGLVLAIYSLVLPRAEEILKRRAEVRSQAKKRLTEKLKKDEEGIEDLAREVEAKSKFPAFLGWLVVGCFILYIVSSLGAWWSLFIATDNALAFWVPRSFILATLVFMIIGLSTITEIHALMTKTWQQHKEKPGKA